MTDQPTNQPTLVVSLSFVVHHVVTGRPGDHVLAGLECFLKFENHGGDF
jgi:hypothetical protein